MRYLYRPKHPQADENGMIEAEMLDCGPNGAAPYVISDAMNPVKHMGTGRMIDSKSKFRADTRASGCVEIGNEPIKPRQPIALDKGQRRDAIRQSLYELRNR